jgi:outer membrane protein OmpA-like peptidoglycan-associated protein
MTSKIASLTGIVLCGALALSGCKKKEEPVVAPAATPEATAAAAVPAAAAAGTSASTPAPAAAATPFDPQSVPVSTATIPPFPLVDRPEGTNGYSTKQSNFDRAYFIAGNELRPVEGRLSDRWFPPSAVNMSLLEAYRNYDNVLKSLGAVVISRVHPEDKAFVAANGGDADAVLKKLRIPALESDIPEGVPAYAAYLLRTSGKNFWIAFSIIGGKNVQLLVVEEKAMEQTVKLIKADEMASVLDKQGRIALYVNFDTDSDAIKPDSAAIVDEIAKLLRANGQLKLSVEGHTDATGDAAHNKDLSLKRAQAVVRAVVAQQIDGKRLSAVGHGADKPLADNASEDG